MGGINYRIIGITTFNFDGLNAYAVSEIALAKNLDMMGARAAILSVRVHDVNISAGSSGSKIEVILKPELPCPEDPSKEFVGSTIATAMLTSGTVADSLVQAGTSAEFGPVGRVVLKATQGATGAMALNCKISFELCLKD